MEKLDRLGWAAGIAIVSYGVRIGVRVNRIELLDRVLPFLPPAWTPSASPVADRLYSIIGGAEDVRPNVRLFNLVYANAERIARTTEIVPALDAFESDVQLAVAMMSPQHVFVHAAVVSWKGQAIVLPGRSFSGKSTLTSQLVAAGAGYYSDDYAVIDEHGFVHPYARPLSLREDGPYAKPRRYTAEALNGQRGGPPLPIGLVVVSTYKAGATWRPRRLSAGQGALALLASTFSMQQQPERALTALHKVVSRATVVKGTRGEARQVVQFIQDWSH